MGSSPKTRQPGHPLACHACTYLSTSITRDQSHIVMFEVLTVHLRGHLTLDSTVVQSTNGAITHEFDMHVMSVCLSSGGALYCLLADSNVSTVFMYRIIINHRHL